jgi:hypothetical protein
VNLSPLQVVAAVGVLVVLAWVWRAGSRRARVRSDAAGSGARLVSLAGRVAFTAGLIAGVQWWVLTRSTVGPWVVLAALGLPALFASYTLTRALTVVASDAPRKRGGRR